MIRVTPLILAVALFMEQMDSTVIATSLPAIAANIGAEPTSLKLALTSYFVALAIFIPLSGWVADRFGATNVFRVAIIVFVVGSIACAFSNSLLTFVLARFLQGIGGSMMTPIARLVLVRSTPRNQLVAATSWLTIPGLIGPLTGPPIGGFITTYLTWHWIFWINVPIGIVGVILVSKFLKDVDSRNERPMDFGGLVLSAITFAGIIFGFSVISLPAIPLAAGWGSIAIGLVAGVLYLRRARHTAFPILDPKMFGLPLFRRTMTAAFFVRIGMGAFPFLMPLMLQLSFGLTPLESGLTTFIVAIGAITSKFSAERMFAAIGFPRLLLVAGLASSALLAINGLFMPDTPHWLLMAALLLGGLARSFFFTGVNALSFADVDEQHASQATAINAVMQQLSIATGVAVAGAALEISSNSHGGELTLGDFHTAWFVVAAVSLLGVIPFLRMPPDSGSDVSGHRVKPASSPTDGAL